MEQRQPTEFETAWQMAIALAHHVQSGGTPSVQPPSIMLAHGEVQHGQMPFEMWRFFGMDVSYSTNYLWLGGPLLGAATLAASAAANASRKARAEAQARAQWRPFGPTPAIVTNHRLLQLYQGQWLSFHHDALIEVRPDPRNWTVVLMYEGTDAMMLRGPWVPWLCVLIFALRHGTPWQPGTDYRPVFGITGS